MLNRVDILRVLSLGWRLRVTPESEFTQKQLVELVAPGSDSTLNRGLKSFDYQGRVIDDVAKALHDPNICSRVEAALGINGILSVADLPSLFDLVDKNVGSSSCELSVHLANPTSTSLGYSPTEEERAAARNLCNHLIEADNFKTVWKTNFTSGASTVAQILRFQPEFTEAYERVFFIRPSDLTNPYQAELLEVAKELSIIQNSPRAFGHFCASLVETRSLLVFLACSAVKREFPKQSFLKQISDDLSANSGSFSVHAGPSHLLFVGSSEGVNRLEDERDKALAQKLRNSLALGGKTRTFRSREIFETQMKRYCKSRSLSEHHDIGGSRLKRAFWHYSPARRKFVDQNKWPEWPIAIKFRAYCYSNMTNHSYSDPTAGLSILGCDQEKLPLDIYEYLRDIQSHVDLLSQSREFRDELRVARRTSTGKYWLTLERLQILLKKKDLGEVQRIAEVACPTWNSLVRKWFVTGDDAEQTEILVSPLAVRCVVQQQWQNSAPQERSISHLKIAQELLKARHEASKLTKDFPLSGHWGDTGIFFVSEAIRHLVRSMSPAPYREVLPFNEEHLSTFPDEPSRDELGTDPSQVINYCYKQLFCRTLNEPDGLSDRALTKKSGAYHLTVELLQLLSKNNVLGKPHPALHVRYQNEYKRHCAFALLDIGRLVEAREIFDDLAAAPHDDDDALEHLDDRINLSLILTVVGSYELANQAVETALIDLANFTSARALNKEMRRRVRQLLRRIQMRQAHLSYLADNPEITVALLQSLMSADAPHDRAVTLTTVQDINGKTLEPLLRDRFEPEVTQLLIAARARCNEDSARQAAYNVCLPSFLDSASNGMNHDAMGYKISMAHLLRKDGHYHRAELFLDSVNKDLLRHGCSERTYLAFLMEAGRLLLETARPVRAYASYLNTAIVRAKARGFHRETQTLKSLVEACFEEMDMRHRTLGIEAWEEYIESELRAQASQNKREEINLGAGNSNDPVFAYGIVDRSSTIELCRMTSGMLEAKVALEILFDEG